MKNKLLIPVIFFLSFTLNAQNATNFNCKDCSGATHDLFTELDAGKIIVLCWVMPCASCVGPSLTTYNIVQSFQASHPGKVFMYLCDDYADTPCVSLASWANTYGMTNLTMFSNSAISMTDYGTPGMPKIVVVGPGYSVYYNSNNTVDPAALQNAINNAILVSGIGEQLNETHPFFSIIPNPATDKTQVSIQLAKSSNVEIELFDHHGRHLGLLYSNWMNVGSNQVDLNLAFYSQGIYLLRINDGENIKMLKIVKQQ